MVYDREKAILYAHKWAYGRNPEYYNFDLLGGDCTNFISQCLFAGFGTMHRQWYYRSLNDRTPSWSGVEFLYEFLIENKFANEMPLQNAIAGDIIQLSFDGEKYGHSLFVVEADKNIHIATHTLDCDMRPLDTYTYNKCRLLHIA